MEKERIFSGDKSTPLWDIILQIPNKDVENAVYALACKCQELEAIVVEQGKLIKKLSEQQKDQTDR